MHEFLSRWQVVEQIEFSARAPIPVLANDPRLLSDLIVTFFFFLKKKLTPNASF